MDIRTPALAALAAGCLIGGAAGAYLVGGARQTGAPAIGDTATDVTAAGPQTATPDQPASDPARYAAPVASAPVRRATPVQPAREHVDTIEPPPEKQRSTQRRLIPRGGEAGVLYFSGLLACHAG